MEIELKETSKVFKPVFLITFLPVLLILSVLLVKAFHERDNLSIVIYVAAIVIEMAVVGVLQLYKLDLVMNQQGISYKYRPYQRSFLNYEWNDIDEVKIITFDLIGDFKGWGRKTSGNYGTGFLTEGNTGILIKDKSGNIITITVLNADKASEILTLYSK